MSEQRSVSLWLDDIVEAIERIVAFTQRFSPHANFTCDALLKR